MPTRIEHFKDALKSLWLVIAPGSVSVPSFDKKTIIAGTIAAPVILFGAGYLTSELTHETPTEKEHRAIIAAGKERIKAEIAKLENRGQALDARAGKLAAKESFVNYFSPGQTPGGCKAATLKSHESGKFYTIVPFDTITSMGPATQAVTMASIDGDYWLRASKMTVNGEKVDCNRQFLMQTGVAQAIDPKALHNSIEWIAAHHDDAKAPHGFTYALVIQPCGTNELVAVNQGTGTARCVPRDKQGTLAAGERIDPTREKVLKSLFLRRVTQQEMDGILAEDKKNPGRARPFVYTDDDGLRKYLAEQGLAPVAAL